LFSLTVLSYTTGLRFYLWLLLYIIEQNCGFVFAYCSILYNRIAVLSSVIVLSYTTGLRFCLCLLFYRIQQDCGFVFGYCSVVYNRISVLSSVIVLSYKTGLYFCLTSRTCLSELLLSSYRMKQKAAADGFDDFCDHHLYL